MDQDPLVIFNEIFSRAGSIEGPLYNAAALATVSDDSSPSVRMVLVKQADARGFVFFTNFQSRKARELAANPRAALCFWWPRLASQVRVEGAVEPVDESDADEYFASRPRESQIGAWASRQSEPVEAYEDLLRTAEEASRRFANRTIPRPPHWSGLRIVPRSIEFWRERPGRLHERRLFVNTDGVWRSSLLQP
jgi:pyridoxamine 5'-phosphate oxidase